MPRFSARRTRALLATAAVVVWGSASMRPQQSASQPGPAQLGGAPVERLWGQPEVPQNQGYAAFYQDLAKLRSTARLMATAYRDELLPRSKKAYSVMFERYGQMLASYPRVLDVQRKLYALQTEYIMSLEAVWTNGLALQGFLLTDGLESPARPGDVDRPIRETNVPMPERTMAPTDRAMPRP